MLTIYVATPDVVAAAAIFHDAFAAAPLLLQFSLRAIQRYATFRLRFDFRFAMLLLRCLRYDADFRYAICCCC